MARVGARGIHFDLPEGWDARIERRETVPAAERASSANETAPTPPARAHAATFSLPAEVGDFGSGAVELMRSDDLFLSLVEFDADSLGTALFANVRQPRSLRVTDFDRQGLQRVLPGQAGAQVFFTTSGRPFCLYVVLGSFARRNRTVPVVNDVLQGIRID